MVISRRAFVKTAALGSLAASLPIHLCSDSSFARTLPADFLDAVRRGDLATVRNYLQADASLLNRTDDQGRTAYALALLNEHDHIASFLKGQGYQSDLHEAALARDWDRYAFLVDEHRSLVNADHPVGGTTMFAAATGGAGPDMWRVYAEAGDPNAMPRGSKGTTPLQAALMFPDREVAELTAAALISNAANPDPELNASAPPLHLAAGRGMIEMVEMLIHFGADPNRMDHAGRSARTHARRYGQSIVVSLLDRADQIPRVNNSYRAAYKAGGDPYAEPVLDRLPQMERERLVGAAHNDFEWVKTVTNSNPDFAHSVATTGERAVEAAAHMGRREIVTFLLEIGAPCSLPTAVMLGEKRLATHWLDERPDRIHERGAHGFPLLWYPIIGGNDLDMMELLLERGCDVEQQHFLGTTALHWACRGESVQMVKLLLDHGANPNRKGRKFGSSPMTPLQLARNADRKEIIRLLEGAGAR